MKKDKDDLKFKLLWFASHATYALIYVAIIVSIVAYVYAMVVYGNTPVSEMPVWVYLILGGRK